MVILVILQRLVNRTVVAILLFKVYPIWCGELRFQLSEYLDTSIKVTQDIFAYISY